MSKLPLCAKLQLSTSFGFDAMTVRVLSNVPFQASLLVCLVGRCLADSESVILNNAL